MNPYQPLALRAKEAAKALGISERYLWQLTKDGHIPCARIGSGKRQTVLYSSQELHAWLIFKTQNPCRDSRRTAN